MLRTLVWKRKALVALQTYHLGDTIHALEGHLSKTPTQTSIEIGPHTHVEDEYGAYMNHSCLPNTVIHNGKILAIHTISKGMEITYNYRRTETLLKKPFVCDFCKMYIDGKNTVCPTYKKDRQ